MTAATERFVVGTAMTGAIYLCTTFAMWMIVG
jgi:hypothetical protein